MCQLLGLSFNQDIQPGKNFSTLLSRSILNPHGWGLACYPNESSSAVVFKEPVPGSDSQLAEFLCNYSQLRSKVFIGHIRKATKGNNSYDNTHPFTRCYSGREFTFAHNGTLKYRKRLKGLIYQPVGGTDSERAFCYLLSQLRMYEIKPVMADRIEVYDAIDFQIIYEILLDINTRTAGAFNCLYSDGKYLFCYRDLAEARNLFYQKYHGKADKNETGKTFQSKKSCMEKSQTMKGVIVATEPLNDGHWQSFSAGHLMVFKDGEVASDIS